jgi:hypothetical protein
MAAIAFTDAQLEQIMTAAYQIPRALRQRYLQRVSELLNGGTLVTATFTVRRVPLRARSCTGRARRRATLARIILMPN